MRLAMLLRTCVVLVVVLLGTPSPALSQTRQDRAEARKLAGEALDLYNAGDYEAALEKFEQADTLVVAPTLKLRAARCLDKMDRMLDARRKYREVIEMQLKRWAPPVHRNAQKEATKELKELLEAIPSVTIVVKGTDGAEAVVELDGEGLNQQELLEKRQIDPGLHVFEARLDDRQARENLEVKRGERKRVVLTIPPPPQVAQVEQENPFVWQVAGWSSLGVGVVGLTMGTVAGVLVLEEDEQLSAQCPNRQCPRSVEEDVDSFDTLRALSTAGFIVGGVGVAAGATLLVLAPADAEDVPAEGSVAVRPWIGPMGVGVRGQFW